MPTKAELSTWMRRHRYGTADAARILHVNIRTVQRWLSQDRRIPNWLEGIIGK